MWLRDPNVWLDVSTYCNAACPQCHRTNPNGLGKADWLPLLQWNLETFKKVFPHLSRHRQYNFCGTWGDPAMNKDILPIVQYITDNSKSKIVIDTNGAMRDEEFWWELGCAGKDQLTVVFAVDGSTQEMHAKYRRKTELSKVLNHMKELSSTPAEAWALTIVFKHNEKHIAEISDLVKSYGAYAHKWLVTDRFYSAPTFTNDSFSFINERGQQDILEAATVTDMVTKHSVEEIYRKKMPSGVVYLND